MSASRSIVMVGLTIASAACAGYQKPLVGTDRPGYTFGTATAPLGAVQAEAGYTDTRYSTLTYQTVGEGLLRVGAGPNTELRIFSNSYALKSDAGATDNGMEDTKIGLKQRIFAGKASTGFGAASVALLPATSVPTGSKGFGAEAWQPELLVAAALPVTSKVAFVTNVGDAYVKLGDDRSHKLLATLAGWYTFSGKVSGFAEYGGSQLSDSRASRLQYFDAGFAVVPLPSIQLDFRVGHGVNGVPNDNYLGVGIVRRW